MARIDTSIKEVVGTATSLLSVKNVVLLKEDSHLQSCWPRIKFKPFHGRRWDDLSYCNLHEELIEKWTLPKEGWIKVNFDGASKGNPGEFSVGVVFQDWKGNIIAWGAK